MPRRYLKATRSQILTRTTLLAPPTATSQIALLFNLTAHTNQIRPARPPHLSHAPKKIQSTNPRAKKPNLPRFYKIHTKFNQLQILSHTPAPATLLAKNKNFKILILLKLPQTHTKILNPHPAPLAICATLNSQTARPLFSPHAHKPSPKSIKIYKTFTKF